MPRQRFRPSRRALSSRDGVEPAIAPLKLFHHRRELGDGLQVGLQPLDRLDPASPGPR